MITGNDAPETMRACADHGACDFAVKPFDFPALEFAVYSKVMPISGEGRA
jgi:DNA-binding NtrC family response regulator